LEEIEVIGAIVYTGMDAAARQTSAFFGGSDAVFQLIDAHNLDVREIMDKITTTLKCVYFTQKCFFN
jgi:hypothetical protein